MSHLPMITSRLPLIAAAKAGQLEVVSEQMVA